jgi:hypothetical protein
MSFRNQTPVFMHEPGLIAVPRKRHGRVPVRTRAVVIFERLVLCGSSGAAAGNFQGPLFVSRYCAALLCDERLSTLRHRHGGAVPIQIGEVHSLENTGTQPLELMVVGVARDLRKELELVDAGPAAPRRN